jgi:hypothetical protein
VALCVRGVLLACGGCGSAGQLLHQWLSCNLAVLSLASIDSRGWVVYRVVSVMCGGLGAACIWAHMWLHPGFE